MATESSMIQYEANVDDMDPRLWPSVLDHLLEAGANDAWLTPITMKKGRPAFTLSALCTAGTAAAVRAVMFRETSTIGLREVAIVRHALDRAESTVTVQGETISVKQAFDDGELVNQSVEWDDVIAASTALGLTAKQVLDAAIAAAEADRTSD